ncbi:hypothetical protein TGAM01_v200423 [Trichoderma gamsii]|uniref:Uncharacterized protein n=1 Tax=Trichoderma gamsii TaxID=398673 RepID=A0A0W7VVH8_9HYPO|nr:hypothetical protein TGAM01_v200423 [Trichoderma gamsii]PNP48043.1 hypothetical protein TGAMA5MH_00700 [Trichoderma gamsii]PON31003.1 hypothetical protein TGAM01_v200423 [Trichoderma gamsii]
MKVATLFGAVAALAGPAAAFWGQMAAGNLEVTGEGPASQTITLTDYNTGSKYSGQLVGGFSGNGKSVFFNEITPGGYYFYASLWRTSDGCHNIDFEGALSAGHGFCCGSLPCDLGA